MGKYVNQLDSRIQLTDKAAYRREQYQSYMTGPEWRNVEMAEEYGKLLRENKSMFQFPYFRQIFDLWKVVFNSYSAARKYDSISTILFSEYMIMDLFVATFTTMELLPKGIISLLLYPFLKKDNASEMQQHLATTFEHYAANLQTIPFYDHKYSEMRADLAEKYRQCEHKTWVDWFSWTVVSCELWARKWISKPLSYWYHQENNEVPPSTDILVKFNAQDIDNPEDAKRLFQEQLAQVEQEHAVHIVDTHIYAKDSPKTKDGQTYTSVYARLRAPRYAAFQPVVRALGEQGIELRKIAGQDRVQVKCIIDTDSADKLLAKKEALNQTKKIETRYSYWDHIQSNREICLVDAPVRNLHKTLKRLEKQDDVEVSFIHNF